MDDELDPIRSNRKLWNFLHAIGITATLLSVYALFRAALRSEDGAELFAETIFLVVIFAINSHQFGWVKPKRKERP